jgi:hypothetical protein
MGVLFKISRTDTGAFAVMEQPSGRGHLVLPLGHRPKNESPDVLEGKKVASARRVS